MSLGTLIKGTITRLVKDVEGGVDKVFFAPHQGQDVSGVDGKHKAGLGEIVATAAHDGLSVGASAVFQLAENGVMTLVDKLEGNKPAAASTSSQAPATGGPTLPAPAGVESLLGQAADRLKQIGESALSEIASRIESAGASYLSGFATKLEGYGASYLAGLSGKVQALVDQAIADIEKKIAAAVAKATTPPAP